MAEDDVEPLPAYREAFGKLPWLQREIFILHRIQGLSYQEIARLLGLSERYVERQMAKAIAGIAKQLAGRPLRWWERWF